MDEAKCNLAVILQYQFVVEEISAFLCAHLQPLISIRHGKLVIRAYGLAEAEKDTCLLDISGHDDRKLSELLRCMDSFNFCWRQENYY